MKYGLKLVLLVFGVVVSSILIFGGNIYAGWFDNGPVHFLEEVKDEANEDSDGVQVTAMDNVITSKGNSCGKNSNYTFANTLCSVRDNLYHYLKYVVYIGLAAATILLIWNAFTVVVSTDNEKKFSEFWKNAKNIGIGVLLLLGFYIIIEIFVSVVNLITQ